MQVLMHVPMQLQMEKRTFDLMLTYIEDNVLMDEEMVLMRLHLEV